MVKRVGASVWRPLYDEKCELRANVKGELILGRDYWEAWKINWISNSLLILVGVILMISLFSLLGKIQRKCSE